MKHSKRYIILISLIGALFVIKHESFMESNTVVRGERTALKVSLWNPLIAKSVNESLIVMLIDGKEANSEAIFMDERKNLMIPVSTISENFNCAAHVYDNSKLVVEKYMTKAEFFLEGQATGSDKIKNIVKSSMIQSNGEFYVPLKAVAESLGYTYEWDIEKKRIVSVNQNVNSRAIPYKYDLREAERAPDVKNQGRFGTCWAFASLAALESSMMPEQKFVLAPDHMTLRNSFTATQNDGGEYTMAMAYLTSWQGPVLEEADPYGDGKSPDNLKPVKHVQEVQIIEGKDFERIKEAVYKYGGVESSLYSSLINSTSKSIYYNRKTNSYCYIGKEKPNHDVVIIGWDDNYSRENFNMELEGDGAFICQNSWGENFGDNGVFYISYYDTNIGMYNIVYTGVENADNYDNIYQADLCGWVGQLGYEQESAFFANVYETKQTEEIAAIGIYALGKDTEYEIYIVDNFVTSESLNERRLLKSGFIQNSGFYTIKLPKPVILEEGTRFAMVVRISTPNSIHPVAIEFEAGQSTANVDLSDGEGYISRKGTTWENVEDNQNCNLCLKVYTNNK